MNPNLLSAFCAEFLVCVGIAAQVSATSIVTHDQITFAGSSAFHFRVPEPSISGFDYDLPVKMMTSKLVPNGGNAQRPPSTHIASTESGDYDSRAPAGSDVRSVFVPQCLDHGTATSIAGVWQIVTDSTGPGTVAVQYTIELRRDGTAFYDANHTGYWSQSGASVTITIEALTLSLTGSVTGPRTIGGDGWTGRRTR
jgi:hypothetical protein